MTQVTVQECGGAPGTYRLTAVGHATGSREVCAAVSGIVYALGGYLKNLERAGAVKLGAFMLESGAAAIEADGKDLRAPFEMAAIGLLQIAEKYPDGVAVDTMNFFKSPVCIRP